MKTAIIGANGFLGVQLIHNLKQKGEGVLAVFNRNHSNIPSDVDAVSMQEFLRGNQPIDNIIFAAGSFRNSVSDNVKLNCEVLYPITEKYSHCKLVYISSSNVYGNHAETIKEDSCFENPTDYGKSKLSGEFIASKMRSHTIVRLVYLYGKGLENGSFLPFIINFAKSEKKMKLFGKGKREQDYLHVEDAAELCVKALFSENNHIYLGATGDSTSNKKVAEIISEEIEGFGEIELPDQEEKAPSFYFDASWTQKTLDWHPKKTIENGIKEMML